MTMTMKVSFIVNCLLRRQWNVFEQITSLYQAYKQREKGSNATGGSLMNCKKTCYRNT